MRFLLVPLLLIPLAGAAAPLVVTSADWAAPRSGAQLLQHPALMAAMSQLDGRPDARLRLIHPPGEAGRYWAQELVSWLVSLGLASDRIELTPGAPGVDQIELRVLPAAVAPGR